MRRVDSVCAACCVLVALGGCDQGLQRFVTYSPRPTPVLDPIRVESFTQTSVPRMDLLFVIDLAGVSPAAVSDLADGFRPMIAQMQAAGVDFHAGVVSAQGEGALRELEGVRWVDAKTKDGATLLSTWAFDGVGLEQGPARPLDVILDAIDTRANPDNAGFRRASAPWHVVVLSDSADDSRISEEAFVDAFDTERFPWERSFSAFVGPLATELRSIGEAVGGHQGTLRDDLRGALEELAVPMAGLQHVFHLSRPLALVNVDVQVATPSGQLGDPLIVGEGFRYERPANAVALIGAAPAAGSVVQVTYEAVQGWR